MPLQSERSDWWIAAAVAVVVHVALILFLLRLSGPKDESPSSRPQVPAEESYRDIPAAPDGIPADSLPLSGLRGPPGEDHPIIIECRYEFDSAANHLRLLHGALQREGLLGCAPGLASSPALMPSHIRVHYDPFGTIQGITGDELADQFFPTVSGWQLARPRPGRQWQAGVIFDLTLQAR